MHMATRIAAWVLALYALGYTLLLLFFLGGLLNEAPELAVFALLLIPAVVAFYSACRIGRVFQGEHRGLHLFFGVVMFCAAGYFGALFLSEMSIVRQAARVGGSGPPGTFVLLMFGLPMVLSAWVALVYLWSGMKFIRGAQR